jgi:hypothetical protein
VSIFRGQVLPANIAQQSSNNKVFPLPISLILVAKPEFTPVKANLSLIPMQPTVMNLACVTLGMSMPEALIAATLNAAASLGRGSTHGAIQKGRVGDLVIINAHK